MITKIVNSGGDSGLEVKRFYLTADIYAECPSCGVERRFVGADDYILYGGTGKNMVSFSCEMYGETDNCCSHEWEEEVYVEMIVRKRLAAEELTDARKEEM